MTVDETPPQAAPDHEDSPEAVLRLEALQLRQAFERQRSSVLWTLGATLVFLVPLMPFWSLARGAFWLFLLMAVLAVRALAASAYSRSAADPARTAHWQRAFIAGAVAAGLSWSAGPLLLMQQVDAPQTLLLAMMPLAVSSIAASQMAAVLPAAMAFVATALWPTAVMLLMRGDAAHQAAALVVASASIVLMLTSRSSNRIQVSLLRAEARLGAALQEARRTAREQVRVSAEREIELERLSSIVAGTGAGIAELHVPEGRLRVNERFASMLGREVQALQALDPASFGQLFHEQDLQELGVRYQALMEGQATEIETELRLRHAQGHWVWCQLRARVLARDPQGHAQLVSGTYVDVTGRREAEQRWRSRAELSADWFWETDPSFRVTLLSDGVRHGLPLAREQLIGRRLASVRALRPLDDDWSGLAAQLNARLPFSGYALAIEPGRGERQVVELEGRPRFDARGEFLGYEGVGRDVTERRRATESLRESLLLVDGLFEAMPIPVLMKDQTGRYLRANRAYREMMATQGRDVVHVRDIHDRDASLLHQSVDEELLRTAGVRRYEVRQTLDNGQVIHGMVHKASLVGADGGIRGLVATLIDISDERAAAAALQAARDAAEQASRAKSAFLATMSHELRTPLNAVIGAAQLLRTTPAGSRDRDELIAAIENSGLSLLGQIESVMDLSRIEAAELRLAREPFDLAACVHGIMATAGVTARQRGLRLEAVLAPGLAPHRLGDPARLRQVLLNLVGNALKFTPQGEVVLEVDVPDPACVEGLPAAGAAGDLLRFRVRDTGIGIDAELQQVIFEPFRQVEAGATRRYTGSGLGLAIVRELVRAMQGRVSVRSEPGRGSEFECVVPLPVVVVAAAGPSGAAPLLPPRQATAAPHAQAAPRPAPRVLLVEDDPTNQLITTAMLGRRGCEVVVADDGRTALQRLASERFDLVLMDWQMPDLDGLETTRRIRAGEAGAHAAALPIVAVTANAFIEDRAACLAAGMDDFVSKPLSLELLLDTVDRWLAPSQAARLKASEAGTG